MINLIKKLAYPLPEHTEASEQEIAAIKKLALDIKGTLVFDSLRDNHFSIFEFDLAQNSIKKLINGKQHAIYPDVASHNSFITFAQAENTDRQASADIYILQPFNDTAERVARNGTYPTINAAGDTIYFERNRKELIKLNLASGEEKKVFPVNEKFGDYAVVKPRISPDETLAVFTSDKGGRWNCWCANLITGDFHHVVKGCEATWFPDNNTLAWIKKYGLLSNVGIYTSNVFKANHAKALQDAGPPFGHEYFPTLILDGKYLLYAACPNAQHDHIKSWYQLFIKNTENGQITRLTYDKFNNRWPKLRPTR